MVSGADPPSAPPPAGPRARRPRLAPLAWVLAGALIAAAAFLVVDRGGTDEGAAPVEPTPATTAPAEFGAAEVYEVIRPSLVFVDTAGTTGRADSIGSGVVVNAAGDIMTAHHVVRGASAIEVTFADGTRAAARIVEEDPANDIAILAATQLPQVVVPAVLGGSGGLRVGDTVYTAGNPLGFTESLTAGVASGLGRSIRREDGEGVLQGLIQFDAAVNPGSSGGPLLNAAGQVVGIVTAIANPSEQRTFIGIGFAVPIETAGGAAGGPER